MQKLKDYEQGDNYEDWIAEVVRTYMLAAAGAVVLMSLLRGKQSTEYLLRRLKHGA